MLSFDNCNNRNDFEFRTCTNIFKHVHFNLMTDIFDFTVYENEKIASKPAQFSNIEEFRTAFLNYNSYIKNPKSSFKLTVFRSGLSDSKDIEENKFGGYFNIVCDVNYLGLRCFVYIIFKLLNHKFNENFQNNINGVVFKSKRKYFVQVWVNDGYVTGNIEERYNELMSKIINPLHGTNFAPLIEFFPLQNYKKFATPSQNDNQGGTNQRGQGSNDTYNQFRRLGYNITPFAKCLEDISPSILQFPKEPKFSMDVATVYKIPWSERRKKAPQPQEENH